MGTDYFLYRKDNNTAFDLGRGSFAFNFGYLATNKNFQLEFTDKVSLLSLVVTSLHYRDDNPSACLLIRDRLLDFLERTSKTNVIFLRDETLGELLEHNIHTVVTHNIYYEEADLEVYENIRYIEEYNKNPFQFFKEKRVSKGNNL